eukprot:TRINITY_DN2474_c0_g1_i1.p2 TRINITY_DN2474_c0_g1~~TRINITY_DN2474_c0_g1_i1.p2  ORF type:complete len:196 (+),score=40.39 TRINITY_DN2474_c0_g1_i1:58-645(+)
MAHLWTVSQQMMTPVPVRPQMGCYVVNGNVDQGYRRHVRGGKKAVKKERFDQPRDARYVARVVAVGESPVLEIDGQGEFCFAYRSVKKRPGEPRALISVGNVVECRLTTTTPRKAISIRIISGSGIALTKTDPESPGYPAEYERSRTTSQTSSSASDAEIDAGSLPDLEEVDLPDEDNGDDVEFRVDWVESLLCC